MKIWNHTACSYFHFFFYIFIIIITISRLLFLNFLLSNILLLNVLIQPVIFESLKDNGLVTLLSLYSLKYLSAVFVPYGSFLETNISLTSISTNWIIFYFCRRPFFWFFLSSKFMFLPIIFIYSEEKKWFFYNNLGIRAVILCFFFVLIGLIKWYKKL